MQELEKIIEAHISKFPHPKELPAYEKASLEQKGAVLLAQADMLLAGMVPQSVTMGQFYEMVRVEQQVSNGLSGGSGLTHLCYVQGDQDEFTLNLLTVEGSIVQGVVHIPKYGKQKEQHVERILPIQQAARQLKQSMTRDELYKMIIRNIEKRSVAEENMQDVYVHEECLANVQKHYRKIGYRVIKTREEKLETKEDEPFRIYSSRTIEHLHAIARILRADVLVPYTAPYPLGHEIIGQNGNFKAHLGELEVLPPKRVYIPKEKESPAPTMEGVIILRPRNRKNQ